MKLSTGITTKIKGNRIKVHYPYNLMKQRKECFKPLNYGVFKRLF